jgi:hypothetical protein
MSDVTPQSEVTTSAKREGQSLLRRAALRAAVAAAFLTGGILTLRGLEAAMHATFDKPPASLSHELSTMSRSLGQPVRYISTKTDEVLDPETVDTLGTDKYLVRQFEDKTLSQTSPGAILTLNVNYYPMGSSTPHVPEACWKGVGREEAPNSRIVFAVPNVRRRDGSDYNLRMRMISFRPLPGQPTTNSKGEPIYSNVAYVFHVNGDYVASPQEVTSHFWKASFKYAYHAKIEITPLERIQAPDGSMVETVLNCTQDDAKRIVSDFVREALPAVEECLPDPAILTQNEPMK